MRVKCSEAPCLTKAPVADRARPIVMVLDDDQTIRQMIKVLLEVAAGVRILEAETSDQALTLAEHFKLDLFRLCNC